MLYFYIRSKTVVVFERSFFNRFPGAPNTEVTVPQKNLAWRLLEPDCLAKGPGHKMHDQTLWLRLSVRDGVFDIAVACPKKSMAKIEMNCHFATVGFILLGLSPKQESLEKQIRSQIVGRLSEI